MKEQSDKAAFTEEIKAKLAGNIQDLTAEKRKVNIAHSNINKIVTELEYLQSSLQDSKKLKEAALIICNKVKQSYFLLFKLH